MYRWGTEYFDRKWEFRWAPIVRRSLLPSIHTVWRIVATDLYHSKCQEDRKLLARFIIPAPFSRFNLELDNESPGRLGQYMGWQIVKSYMENNTTPVLEMLQMEATEIFNNAKFKPKK